MNTESDSRFEFVRALHAAREAEECGADHGVVADLWARHYRLESLEAARHAAVMSRVTRRYSRREMALLNRNERSD